jgi:N-terminal domain of (some) glycogen debranching enzymes
MGALAARASRTKNAGFSRHRKGDLRMAFKVQVGPAHIAIHQGQTVLVTEPDGQVNWPSKRGLYFRDTRVISAWAIYANGELWDLLNGGAVARHAARIFQTNRAFVSEDGPIAARTLGLMIGRHIDGGLHEDIDITNNSQNPVRFNLEIAIRADFADTFEVKSDHIVRRGRITTSWSDKRQALRITYRNKDFCREVIVNTGEGDGEPTVNANGRLSFDIALKAGQAWHRCLIYDLVDGKKRILAPRECTHSSAKSDHAGKMDEWQRTVLKIDTAYGLPVRVLILEPAARRAGVGGVARENAVGHRPVPDEQHEQRADPHATVDHARGEYVVGAIHTQTIEGFWSIFKHGVVGHSTK